MKYTCIISTDCKQCTFAEKMLKYAFYVCNMQNAHNHKQSSVSLIAILFIIGAR